MEDLGDGEDNSCVADLWDGTGLFSVSVDKGIDFVSDPIIFQKNSEEHSDQP